MVLFFVGNWDDEDDDVKEAEMNAQAAKSAQEDFSEHVLHSL